MMEQWEQRRSRKPKYDMTVQQEISEIQVLEPTELYFMRRCVMINVSGKTTLFHLYVWNA